MYGLAQAGGVRHIRQTYNLEQSLCGQWLYPVGVLPEDHPEHRDCKICARIRRRHIALEKVKRLLASLALPPEHVGGIHVSELHRGCDNPGRKIMPEHAILEDDHLETPVLRRFAKGARCAVVAAYKGATMRYLFRHGATFVIGVEPQKWAYDLCVENMISIGPCAWELDNLALVPWETGPHSTTTLYGVGNDGATLFGKSGVETAEVQTCNVTDWLEEVCLDASPINLMVMNCEGAEYMLFPYLVGYCERVLCQFHGPPISRYASGYNTREDVGAGWYLYE